MKKHLKIILLAGFALLLLDSCYKDNKEDLYQNLEEEEQQNPCDSTVDVSYSADISPILEANCALSGCHVGENPQSGIDLSSYSDVRATARNGRLLGTITGSPGPQMPPSGSPLPSAQIELIRTWVDAGACEN